MLFDFTPKSSVLLIFFMHAVVFAVLLLVRNRRDQDNAALWLGILLLLCALYISPFMFGYAGWYTIQPYRDIMFFVPFQQLFLIGPVIFFYVQSLLNKSFELRKKDLLHFLPAIGYLVYSLIVLIADKLIFSEYYFYADGKDRDLDFWYQMCGVISLAFYLILSLRFYSVYKKIAYQTVSFAETILFDWVRHFLVAFLVILLLRILFFIVNPEWGAFGSKFWYYLSFSILFYYIAISGYFNAVKTMIAFRTSLFGAQTAFLVDENDVPEKIETGAENHINVENSAVKEPIIPADIESWKTLVERTVKSEKAYQDPELTLSNLSEILEINSKKLSQIINQGFAMNFNDFVNFYRTEAVIEKFQAGEHDSQNLLEIALDCGFNSKSTFNRAFKKHTNLTPKDYLKKYYEK